MCAASLLARPDDGETPTSCQRACGQEVRTASGSRRSKQPLDDGQPAAGHSADRRTRRRPEFAAASTPRPPARRVGVARVKGSRVRRRPSDAASARHSRLLSTGIRFRTLTEGGAQTRSIMTGASALVPAGQIAQAARRGRSLRIASARHGRPASPDRCHPPLRARYPIADRTLFR